VRTASSSSFLADAPTSKTNSNVPRPPSFNAAQGTGEFSPDEKRRFYRIARQSATESAAILHIMARRGHAPADSAQQARGLLLGIVSMLVRVTKD
jgi:four helix bundle protein